MEGGLEMKKLLLAALFAVFVLPVYAGIDEGIDKGMTHVFVLGGAAFPIGQYEYEVNNGRETYDIGGAAFTYGAQIMHYLTPVFGLGVEFNGANYPSQKTDGITVKTDRYNFMLAGKISLAPQAKARIYIPFGGGVAQVKTSNGLLSEKSTKPAFYAGIGVETDLNDIFVSGFEARYNGFWFDKDKLGTDNDLLSDVSILLKLGMKF
jgi:opacity protein-like surface antigen